MLPTSESSPYKIEVTNLISPLIETFKIICGATKDYFDVGVANYLEIHTLKYYSINTFFYSDSKVVFFDAYQPLTIYKGNQLIDFQRPVVDFGNFNCIAIIGRAGSGKSTLLKYLFLQTIKTKFKVPVIIQLRYFNDHDTNLEDYVFGKLLDQKVKSSIDILKLGMKRGDFIIMLDGYDELFQKTKYKIQRQIIDFMETFPKNKFVITSRPGSAAETLDFFYSFKIKPLTKNDQIGFISKIEKDETQRSKILKDIEILTNNERSITPYKHYLSNPLLLSMFLKTYELYPELPSNKQIFYRNVFDTLYSRHDAINNEGIRRERVTGLSLKQFELFLMAFSYVSYFKGHLNFDEDTLLILSKGICTNRKIDVNIYDLVYDLRTTIGILIHDGIYTTFPHRSLQEYFTVLFISSLVLEKKKVAYEKYTLLILNDPSYGEYNFWELSLEVDKIDFVNLFLIPYIKSAIIKDDSISVLSKFIKTFSFHFSTISTNKEISGFILNEKIPGFTVRQYDYNEKTLNKLKPFLSVNANGDYHDTLKRIQVEYKVNRKIEFDFDESNISFKLLKFIGHPRLNFLKALWQIDDDLPWLLGDFLANRVSSWDRNILKNGSELEGIEEVLETSQHFMKFINVFYDDIDRCLKHLNDSNEEDLFSVDRLLSL